MVKNCSWCGREISGQVVYPSEFVHGIFNGDEKPDIISIDIGFCCDGCVWRWEIEQHGILGITGDKARQHLIEEHNLVHPPGPPAGKQSHECFDFFAREMETISDMVFPELISLN
jgi:hypothetical protein